MKKLIVLLAFFGMLHADEEVMKVVLDLTTSDLHTFEQKVLKGITAHKAHYEGEFKELDVAVVIHGDSYRFFVKDPKSSPYADDAKLLAAYPTLQKRVASMAETYDVEFLMCDSGRVRNKLSTEKIYSFVKMVPNAAIGLIDKQQAGYAYLPVAD